MIKSDEANDSNEPADIQESQDQLVAIAQSLGIAGLDSMSRDELVYAIQKAQGGDGGLSI